MNIGVCASHVYSPCSCSNVKTDGCWSQASGQISAREPHLHWSWQSEEEKPSSPSPPRGPASPLATGDLIIVIL